MVVPLAGANEATVTLIDLITLPSPRLLSIMMVEPGKLVRVKIFSTGVTF